MAAGAEAGRLLTRLGRFHPHTRFRERNGPDPFRILVGCVLSLRTKDEVSYPATARLFARASDPAAMRKLRAAAIERLIYPVGFYRRKAAQIREICRLLLERHAGSVPQMIDDLLALPGVGRKTANLVITLGFALPGICVDTHVHRISNRLGWVRTKHPHETEAALRELLARRHWIPVNEILVRHGQTVCKPISPLCSACPVQFECPKRGVDRRR